jgi:hypothetical protein
VRGAAFGLHSGERGFGPRQVGIALGAKESVQRLGRVDADRVVGIIIVAVAHGCVFGGCKREMLLYGCADKRISCLDSFKIKKNRLNHTHW